MTDSNKIVVILKIIVDGSSLNIALSREKAFGLIFGPAKLTPIMTSTVVKKDQPKHIKKGISYTPSEFLKAEYNHVSGPSRGTANWLKKIEAAKPVNIPTTAAAPLVRFQNIPNKKVANTPGLIKLEYFCTKV